MRDVKPAPPFIATDRLHVSLHAFGRYSNPPQWLIRTLNSSLSRFCHAPVEISFDHLTFGFGSGAVVLRGGTREPLGALRALQTRLLRHLSSGRRTQNTREPHMTICYSPARLPQKKIQPVEWVATEIVLIHSRYGHRQLGSWALDSSMPTLLKRPTEPLQGEMFA